MQNFLYKISQFMKDRYGHDKLGTFILIITGILYFINLFARSYWLFVIALIPLIIYIYRALSKNITKRLYENRKYLEILSIVKSFFKRQYLKIRDFNTHRYVKCPNCKAQLRLKKRTGVQSIHCPRCNSDFKKNILF